MPDLAQLRALTRATTQEPASLIDLLVGGYLGTLTLLALNGSGPAKTFCVATSALLFVGWCAIVAALRLRREDGLVIVAHRLAVLLVIVASYLLLKWLLPVARGVSVDDALHRVDVSIFGVEPTLWLQRFVTPARTEWFSFFYLGYFPLIAAFALPVMFVRRCEGLLDELAMTIVPIVCIGQLTYFLVPGFGPHRHLEFVVQLPSGTFFDIVNAAVANAGAQKDIFPSLHTALPLSLALFAFDHRRLPVFRYTFPLVMFAAANIIVATVYLRWHWAIDVVAGIVLAFIVRFAAVRLAARERTAWPALPRAASSTRSPEVP